MALPAGIETCTLTFGSALSTFGEDAQMQISVTPTHSLTWSATGQPLIAFTKTVEAAPGMPGQIVLPVTDQPGFIDAAGNAFTGWAYQVDILYSHGSQRTTGRKSFQPVSGQTVVDLDLLPGGSISGPVTAPTATVTSVNGLTGAVSVDADPVPWNSIPDKPAVVAAGTTAEQARAEIGAAAATALTAYVSLSGLGVRQATDFDIVADGTTDARPALQSLMDSVSAAGGGHIVLPAGKIRLNTALEPRSNVWISGAGRDVTEFRPLQHGFYFNATAADPIFNAHFSDFTIDGRERTAQKTWKGYHGQYHRQCTWSNLAARNTGMTGIGPDFLDDCLIIGCITEDTGLENDGNTPSGNGIGIGAGGGQAGPWPHESVTIIGCNVKRAKRFGIMYEGGITPQSVKIIGCSVMGSEAGFDISGGTGAILIGNNAYKNNGPGFHVGSATLASSLAGRLGRIMGNLAHQNTGPGILYEADVHSPAGPVFSITENTCSENDGDGIKASTKTADIRHLEISRNTIFNNKGTGIGVYASSGAWVYTSLSLVGNRLIHNGSVSPTPGTQIGIGAPTNSLLIEGNIFDTSAGTDLAAAAIHLGYNGPNVSIDLTHTRPTIVRNTARRHGTFLKQTGVQTLVDLVTSGNVGQTGAAPAGRSFRTITANATMTDQDDTVLSNGATTIYLPLTGLSTGRVYTVKNINATSVNVRTNDGKTIDGVTTPIALAQWAKVAAMYDGANWITV